MICCLNPNCQKPLNPDTHKFCQQCGTPLVPLLHKHYKIIELLETRNWGATYLAVDTDQLNVHCIVKQLALQVLGTDPQAVQLFQAAAKHLQTLSHHPQIPDLLAYFQEGDYLYLVQQWIEGQSLLDQLHQGAFREAQIRKLLLDVLPVLEMVHGQGLVHQDLKPENILQDLEGRYILTDLGIAQFLRSAPSLYTPPEQRQQEPATPGGDLYRLGVTCVHLLTQVSPSNLAQVPGHFWSQGWHQQVSPALSPGLQAILDRLLAVDPSQRYQSAQEVLADLAHLSHLGHLPRRRPSWFNSLQDSQKIWVGTAIAFLTLGGLAGLAYVLTTRTPSSLSPSASTAERTAAFIRRGDAKYNRQDYQAALADYTAAIRLSPDNLLAHVGRGNAHYGLKNYPTALQDYQQALRLEPNNAYALNGRGNSKFAQKDYEGAIADYNQAIQSDPRFALAFVNRGNVKAALQETNAAIEDYSQAIRLNPQYEPAYVSRGIAKAAINNYPGAINDYDQALRINPQNAETLNSRGVARFKLGDPSNAITDFTEAIRLNPKSPFPYCNRGEAKLKLKDAEGAIADCTETIRLDPQSSFAYSARGKAKHSIKRYQAAIDDYTQALQINAGWGNSDSPADTYYNRGSAKRELQDNLGAIEDLQKAADLFQQEGNIQRLQATRTLLQNLQ
ncbi:MAG: tetratricopeptide repeat protein [Acaryochloridaceae cyanobacterium CSU_3_4]|nr:tetratricopeptide repeat protein [Acaryochloridaceae cyanobacterium CSU_3_4]